MSPTSLSVYRLFKCEWIASSLSCAYADLGLRRDQVEGFHLGGGPVNVSDLTWASRPTTVAAWHTSLRTDNS